VQNDTAVDIDGRWALASSLLRAPLPPELVRAVGTYVPATSSNDDRGALRVGDAQSLTVRLELRSQSVRQVVGVPRVCLGHGVYGRALLTTTHCDIVRRA
jgi:hypothetical protein